MKLKVYPIILTALMLALIRFAFVAFLLRPQPLDIGTVDLNTFSDGEYIGFCQNKILLPWSRWMYPRPQNMVL